MAPGVLEKYEHLDKLRTHEGEHKAGGGGAPAASGGKAAGEAGAAAGGAQPCDVINLTVYYTEPVLPHLSPEYAAAASAAGTTMPAGGVPAGSDTLKTDVPGTGETQHPGEWPPAGELQADAEAQAQVEEPGMAKE